MLSRDFWLEVKINHIFGILVPFICLLTIQLREAAIMFNGYAEEPTFQQFSVEAVPYM